MSNELYNTAVLTLAAGIPHIGRLEHPQGTATRTARLCGSRIIVDVVLDGQGRVAEFAQDVKACALGQAAAAILGTHVIGRSAAELRTARDEFSAMIRADGPVPGAPFEKLELLMGVRELKARHESTLLAFDAVVDAVDRARAGVQ